MTWYEEGTLRSIEIPQLVQELLHREVVAILLQERCKFAQLFEVKELV